MGRFGGVLKRAGENILGKIHSETAMPMASERYEGVEASYYFLTQTFFLGGTSPKCPSYHSETRYRKLGLTPPTPSTLSPLLKGGEGRGEGGSYTRMPCPSGYANGLGAIRGGGGFLSMGFFAFAAERS